MLIAYPIPAFYRQIDEPADALTGALWFNTSTNILKVLNSSSEWVNVAEEQDLVLKLIGNNALNILDLTAQANLTAGINANFERDIYTDANGYLNSINTINTTANFANSKFTNTIRGDIIIQDNTNTSTTNTSFELKKTITLPTPDYVYEMTNMLSSTSAVQAAHCYYSVLYEDGTSLNTITNSQGKGETLKTYPNPDTSKKVVSVGVYLRQNASSQTSNENTDIIHGVGYSDLLVETNKITLDFTPTKFMIVANEETTGTGSVTYDISFDNGVNYKEDLTSFTEYEIEETGTELILKQKLNAGASSGTASAYNWGVLLW